MQRLALPRSRARGSRAPAAGHLRGAHPGRPARSPRRGRLRGPGSRAGVDHRPGPRAVRPARAEFEAGSSLPRLRCAQRRYGPFVVTNLVRAGSWSVEGQPEQIDPASGRERRHGEVLAGHGHGPARGPRHRLPRGRLQRGRPGRPSAHPHGDSDVAARLDAVPGPHRSAGPPRSILRGALCGRLRQSQLEVRRAVAAGQRRYVAGGGRRHHSLGRPRGRRAHPGVRRAVQLRRPRERDLRGTIWAPDRAAAGFAGPRDRGRDVPASALDERPRDQ
mmetsp:Transcript_138118/g.441290  ORF Transcript_138118/g.441290 Transcript_138118/m.441290 type:complete len:276 (-) Transcript_138118:1233-2060(-)